MEINMSDLQNTCEKCNDEGCRIKRQGISRERSSHS